MVTRSESWLLLIYRLPRNPSRHRVAVWRHLKAAGGLYLQDSVCTLPDREDHRALLARLSTEIRDNGGQAVVLVAQGLDEEQERTVVDRFNAERDHDYAEITEQCEALLEEIRRETARARFTYAALEDAESNLDRLRRWLDRVAQRDFFNAHAATGAREALTRCDRAYEAFTAQVLEHGECGRATDPSETEEGS